MLYLKPYSSVWSILFIFSSEDLTICATVPLKLWNKKHKKLGPSFAYFFLYCCIARFGLRPKERHVATNMFVVALYILLLLFVFALKISASATAVWLSRRHNVAFSHLICNNSFHLSLVSDFVIISSIKHAKGSSPENVVYVNGR